MKLVMRPGLEMDDVVVIAIFRVGSHFIEEILRWFLPIHLLLLWKIVPIYAFDDAAVEATVAEVPAIPTFHLKQSEKCITPCQQVSPRAGAAGTVQTPNSAKFAPLSV